MSLGIVLTGYLDNMIFVNRQPKESYIQAT